MKRSLEEVAIEMFEPEELKPVAKTRQYREVVILQACVILSSMLLDDIFSVLQLSRQEWVFVSLHLAMTAAYFFVIWGLVRGLSKSPWMLMLFFAAIVSIFGISLAATNPFLRVFEDPRPWLIGEHALAAAVGMWVTFLVFRDIFLARSVTGNDVWGAVCILLLITLFFAGLFNILILIDPGAIGVAAEPGYGSVSEALYSSMCAIIGNSPAYSSMSYPARNLVAVEGFIGNLYLVVLMGRLINLASSSEAPRTEQEQ